MKTTKVTSYPDLGVELREYRANDGRGEGAADHGSEVYTLTGEKVDTTGFVCPASWVMQRQIELHRQKLLAEGYVQPVVNKDELLAQAERINDALLALEVEGFDVSARFRALKVSSKAALTCNPHCKLPGQLLLIKRAPELCKLADDALLDEIACIVGIGE